VTEKGQQVGAISQSIAYRYTNGNLTTEVTPSGQTVGYTYNSNHQITEITVNGTELLTNSTYEPFGPVNGWTWGNGATVGRAYNADGLIVSLSGGATGTLTYNADRTVGTITTDARAGFQASAIPTSLSVAAGSNMVLSAAGGLARTYSYDSDGNTLSDGTRTFTYNAAGRMKSSTNAALTTTYTYNALGQRVRKSNSLATTLFMYDEVGHIVGEYDGGGQLIEEILWLGDTPVASIRPGQGGGVGIFYINTDQLNTPRSLSRTNDNVVAWQSSADPYGAGSAVAEPDGNGSSVTFNLRFPGQYYDAETGLNYNYLRNYDPTVGRYVESDPIGLNGGSYSTYAYANGNPVSNVDPLGLMGAGGGGSASHPQSVQCEECQGTDRVTITRSSACGATDYQCSMALQAAGIAGPYFPTSETVSQTCIAKVVLGVKPAAYVAENTVVSKVPTLARLLGATEAVAGILGQAAERLFGWEASIVVSPLIYDEVVSTRKCPNGG
jgi:RHS repeat-associated protein